jgi:hypothetical protein
MMDRANTAESQLESVLNGIRAAAESSVSEIRGAGQSMVESLRGGAGSLQDELDAIRRALGEMRSARPEPTPVAEFPEHELEPTGDAEPLAAVEPIAREEEGAAPPETPQPSRFGEAPEAERPSPLSGERPSLAEAPSFEDREEEPEPEPEPERVTALRSEPPAADAAPAETREEEEEEPEPVEAVSADRSAERPAASARSNEGARLVALNMALNGAPREETDRYLQENFDLPDRVAVLDDVYARVKG